MTNVKPNVNSTVNGRNCPLNDRNGFRPQIRQAQNQNIRPQNINQNAAQRKPQATYIPKQKVVRYEAKPSKIENAAIAIAETIGEARMLMAEAKAEAVTVKTVRVKERRPIPKKLIFFSIICTMLAMFMVVSFVQINEVTLEIDKLNKQIKTLDSETKKLNLELERKNNLYAVEEYASQKLGMIKENQLKVVYLDGDGEDTIENFETEEEDRGVISTILSAISNNFKSYWNIFRKSE